ncbi:hypothetical protein ACP70R_035659 [Stipagrostis hirtigluma subsp. patula]
MALPPHTPPPPEVPENSSFTATDHGKLISLFLRCKIADEPLPGATSALFHDADIYAAEPGTLTAGLRPAPARKGEVSSWLFFTRVSPKSSKDSRKSRRVGGGVGTWHSEHAPRDVVDGEGNRVGHSQLFSYQRKIGKKSERTGWYMLEFGGADQEADREGRGGGGELVLCKIYQSRSHSHRADGSALKSSLIDSERKRKRTQEEGVDQGPGSARVRRRLLGPAEPTPPAAAQDKITATLESTTCSVIPETQKASDWSFLVAGDAPPAAEYCYGGYGSGIPLCVSVAGTFSGEIGGFLGGVPKYDECDIGGFAGDTLEVKQPGEKPHGNATYLDWSFLQLQAAGTPPAPELCFGTNPMDVGDMSGIPLLAQGTGSSGGLPMNYEWGVDAGFTTAPYACGLPIRPVQPSAAGSWWCGGPEVWSF